MCIRGCLGQCIFGEFQVVLGVTQGVMGSHRGEEPCSITAKAESGVEVRNPNPRTSVSHGVRRLLEVCRLHSV